MTYLLQVRHTTNMKARKSGRMGRPIGIPRQGRYGEGVETTTVRVPVDKVDIVPRLIIELPEIIERYKRESKHTRNWTQADKLIKDIERLLYG